MMTMGREEDRRQSVIKYSLTISVGGGGGGGQRGEREQHGQQAARAHGECPQRAARAAPGNIITLTAAVNANDADNGIIICT